MPTFALVTEGITDQAILENVISGYFQELDIEIDSLMPLRDATDCSRASGYSNWELVFQYCASDKFKEALRFRDYIVVQIDTDVGDHPRFSIDLTEYGADRSCDDIICDVISKFRQVIGGEFFDANHQRLIFAVCVHSIECWLLPIFLPKNRCGKTKNCFEFLKRELDKRGKAFLKTHHLFSEFSRPYLNQSALLEASISNISFSRFLSQLDAAKNNGNRWV